MFLQIMFDHFKEPRGTAPELPPDELLERFKRFLVLVFPLVGIPIIMMIGGLCGAIIGGFISLLDKPFSMEGTFGASMAGAIIGFVCGLIVGSPICLIRCWWKEKWKDLLQTLLEVARYMAIGAFIFGLFAIVAGGGIFLAPLAMMIGALIGFTKANRLYHDEQQKQAALALPEKWV